MPQISTGKLQEWSIFKGDNRAAKTDNSWYCPICEKGLLGIIYIFHVSFEIIILFPHQIYGNQKLSKAPFSLCRCSHGSSRCRTAGIPWCTGTHFIKNKLRSHLAVLSRYSPGSRESKTPVDPRFNTEHLRCSTVEPRFVPVYPGVTQVVYGDVPITAGCATVTCR